METDPFLDQLRAYALAGLYVALSLFMIVLAYGIFSLWDALADAGNSQFLLIAFLGVTLMASILCAGAGGRAAGAIIRRAPMPAPAWISFAVVGAVMVVASAVFKGF